MVQSQLHDEGLVDSQLCQLCLKARGTFLHRSMCEMMAPTRAKAKGEEKEALEKASRVDSAEQPLYEHGIPLKPPCKLKCTGGKRLDKLERWRLPPGAPVNGKPFFTGLAATDGSMLNPAPIAARRAGWSAVAVDEQGCVKHALYGVLQVLRPTAYKAELFAMIRLVQNARLPLTVFCDCDSLVQAFAKGAAYCKSGRRKAADLWRELWATIEAWSPEDQKLLKIVWTKGHANESHIKIGTSSVWQQKVNDHADFYAGMGSAWAIDADPNEQLVKEYKEARNWYRWLERLIADWPEGDTNLKEAQAKRTERAEEKSAEKLRQKGSSRLHHAKPHVLFKLGDRIRCLRCRREAFTHQGRKALRSSACQARRDGEVEPTGGLAEPGPSVHEPPRPSEGANAEERCLKEKNKRRRVEEQLREASRLTRSLGETVKELRERGAVVYGNCAERQATEEALEVLLQTRRRIRGKAKPRNEETSNKAAVKATRLLGETTWRAIDKSHQLYASDVAVFCAKCACFDAGAGHTRQLNKPCTGFRKQEWARKQVKRLKMGNLPYAKGVIMTDGARMIE